MRNMIKIATAMAVFVLAIFVAPLCQAAKLPVTDMKVSAFVDHANTIFKAEDGQPFFPAPTMIPQYSSENEKMYINRIQFAESIAMVQYNADASDSIQSIAIFTLNDDKGKSLAFRMAIGMGEALGMTNQELDSIFTNSTQGNIFKSYCQKSARYIIVSAGWEQESDTYVVRFTASDN